MNRAVRQASVNPDPYRELKRRFNGIAQAMLPGLRARLGASEDPFGQAVRLSVAGNVVDFATGLGPDDIRLQEAVEEAVSVPLGIDRIEALRAAAAAARRIVLVLDNAGEIAFDLLLVERLGPERVVVVVRGGPSLNDALVEDAEQVGLAALVEVLDTGSDLPGLDPDAVPPSLARRLAAADLVIAKGQANFELLHDAALPAPLFFLFRAKCAPVAAMLGVAEGSLVVARGPVADTA